MIALLLAGSLAFVPLDDRPVTLQLPVMLARIAGVPIQTPPPNLLGRYLQPGSPDRIIAWLNGAENRSSDAFIVSADMLAYGGLVASRTPSTPYDAAYFRLHSLHQTRDAHPNAWIAAFGTIMRLAPTGVPALGPASDYFAAYPAWTYLQQYANLHDPPLPSEMATAATLKSELGPTLNQYLDARTRNYGIDTELLALTAQHVVDRTVIGQDDAGPVGLHVKEVAALRKTVSEDGVTNRATIEPGADELGMALVANALARRAHWTPHIAVFYSTPTGASVQDPLEFAPISTAIASLIALCGGVQDDQHPDVVLAVRVPGTTQSLDDTFVAQIESDIAAKLPVALADISFLDGTYTSQASFIDRLLQSHIASQLDAYASWNTNANTVGTALAEAIAAGSGRRLGTYSAQAHREFTFMRFVDDGAFHVNVRPQLNDALSAQGITDHTYLMPQAAESTAALNNWLLWNEAQEMLPQIYPDEHIAAMRITLPWDRTFETKIDVRLAPNTP